MQKIFKSKFLFLMYFLVLMLFISINLYDEVSLIDILYLNILSICNFKFLKLLGIGGDN